MNILIVDDDPDVLALTADVLTSSGYDVTEASTGKDALEAVRTHHPDLVLLDVVLPDMDGFDVCKKIKSDPALRNTFVVLLSAISTSSAAQARGLELGADGYMIKGIPNKELLARVQSFVRIKETESDLKQASDAWEATFNSIVDMVSIHDKDFNVVKVNRAFADALSMATDDLLGKKCYELIHRSGEPWRVCPHRRAMEMKEPVTEEFWEPRLQKFLLVSCSPIVDDRGDVIGTTHVVKDITARRQTEEALKKAHGELDERVRARTLELAGANEQLLKEIEQRQQAEEALQERLRFERLLSDISARFVNIHPDQVDSEIEHGLGQVLEFFQVERCGLLETLRDKNSWQVTHAVITEGLPRVPLRTELPASIYPWTYDKLTRKGEVVAFSRLDELPPEADVDRQTWIEWSIRSALYIPIIVEDPVAHVIAIDSVKSERVWPEEFIPRLRLLGEIFVNALERKQIRLELEERLRFEALISDLSARFVNLPPDLIDKEINQGLRSITEFFDADRCTIGLFSEDGTRLVRAFEYHSSEAEQAVESVTMTQLPWYIGQLFQGKPVVMSRVDDLPPEAAKERELCLKSGMKSVLSVPLMSGGRTLASCALVSTRAERTWPEGLVQRFRALGEVFANAIARQRADRALRESEARLSLAADSAGAVFWAMEISTGRVWVTGKASEPFVLERDEELTFEKFLKAVHSEDRERLRQAVRHAIETRGEYNAEYRVALPGGNLRWIAARGRLHFEPSGGPDRLMGVSLDVTERKQMEEQVQEHLREIEKLKQELEQENIQLRQEVKLLAEQTEIVGQSQAMRSILAQAEQVAKTDSTVLLLGETGTGKELLARAIHGLSGRKGRALVAVNCASLPPTLIESELFGREKGAYTGALTKMIGRFEIANGSTLFLDEIGELPFELQSKLLRVLEEGKFERLGSTSTVHVDVRIIAATNRDIAADVKEGRFRKDLFYRLNVFPIRIPPLRERPEDIPLLVWAFVREFEKRMGKRIDSIPKRSMEMLRSYAWPGNVRELRNVVEHAMIVSSGRTLKLVFPDTAAAEASAEGNLEDVERRHILGVLEKTGWRITGKGGAAEVLGLKRTTLQSRMKKLGIKRRTS